MPTFEAKSHIPCPAHAVYTYHAQPGAFQRLVPSWEQVETLHADQGIGDGAERLMRIQLGPIPLYWRARHLDHVPGAAFSDEMIQGPFQAWRHDHLFLPEAEGCVLHDRVRWALPLAGLFKSTVDRRLERLFQFRHRRTRQDLLRQAPYREIGRLEVVICGRPTRLSKNLAAFLSTAGHRVYGLSFETGKRARFVFRDCFNGELCHPLEGADALIYTGQIPHDGTGDAADPLAFWDFLDRIIRVLGQKPGLLLSLHPQLMPNQESFFDINTKTGSRLRMHRQVEQTSHMLDVLSSLVPRCVELHLATVIGENLVHWVDALLYLESFVFLEDGAPTPTFPWIAHDDVLAAVLHILANPSIRGRYALASPEPATRAEFQRLLLKRHLFGTSWLRMLRVQPWSNPGHPVGLRPELMELNSLSETGFQPLARDLNAAMG